MAETIDLLSDEAARKPYWDQYWKLKEALTKTEKILRALGVTQFPPQPAPIPVPQGASAPIPNVVPTGLFNQPQHQPQYQQEPQPQYQHKPQPVAQPSVSQMVREACKSLQRGITTGRVVEWIKAHYPERDFNRSTVGALLSAQMIQENLIKIDTKGEGGMPNHYILVSLAA